MVSIVDPSWSQHRFWDRLVCGLLRFKGISCPCVRPFLVARKAERQLLRSVALFVVALAAGTVHSTPITTMSVAALVSDSSLSATSTKVTRTLMVLVASNAWRV